MYHKTVPVENESLLVEWEEDLSSMRIKKDGMLIGSIDDKDAIMQGRSFVLPDGTSITVLYRDNELEVWRNGVELVNGDAGESIQHFHKAIKSLQWIGLFQMIISPLFFVSRADSGIVWTLIIIQCMSGALLYGLGYWAKKSRTKTPFLIGLGFCLMVIASNVLSGSFKGLLLMGILAYYLIKAIGAKMPEPPARSLSGMDAPLDSGL